MKIIYIYRGELTRYYLEENVKVGDAYTVTDVIHKPKLTVRVSVLQCEMIKDKKPLFSVHIGEVLCK